MILEIDEAEFSTLMMQGILSADDDRGVNDWVKATKKGTEDTKYSTWMYSKSIDRLRARTFEEFYGDGIVD